MQIDIRQNHSSMFDLYRVNKKKVVKISKNVKECPICQDKPNSMLYKPIKNQTVLFLFDKLFKVQLTSVERQLQLINWIKTVKPLC